LTPSVASVANVGTIVKKFITWIAIGFAGALLPILICHGADSLPPTHSLQTVPTYAGFSEINPFKNHFIIVGDTQSTSLWEFWRERNDKDRKLIVDEIAKREPAFVIHLGDLTTRGASNKHWQQFDDIHRTFRQKQIPYFPILGNHDLYGKNEKALGYYFGRFPYLNQKRWYSFTWIKIGVILVDSNFSDLTEGENEQQKRWYIDELERFEKDEKIDDVIVCCHEPPFTNSRVVRPNKKVETFFANPFLECTKTRFFFSGHSHAYERFQVRGKFFIVSGGGGGPRHRVNINPFKRPYNDLFPGPELRSLHFCETELQDSTLFYRVLSLEPDGKFRVIDQVESLNQPLKKRNL